MLSGAQAGHWTSAPRLLPRPHLPQQLLPPQHHAVHGSTSKTSTSPHCQKPPWECRCDRKAAGVPKCSTGKIQESESAHRRWPPGTASAPGRIPGCRTPLAAHLAAASCTPQIAAGRRQSAPPAGCCPAPAVGPSVVSGLPRGKRGTAAEKPSSRASTAATHDITKCSCARHLSRLMQQPQQSLL